MTGQHERPVAAVRPYVRQAALCDPGTCRCDYHKYGQRPSTEAVLYSGPDAVLLLIHAAIRDGRYEDVHAYADEAQHAIHARFDVLQRRAHRTLAPAIRAWQRADAARKGEVAA